MALPLACFKIHLSLIRDFILYLLCRLVTGGPTLEGMQNIVRNAHADGSQDSFEAERGFLMTFCSVAPNVPDNLPSDDTPRVRPS